jgi:FMN reductase
MVKVVIISGSPAPSSRLTGVLQQAARTLHNGEVELSWVNVRELPPEDLFYTKFDSPAITAANAKVEEAAGVIIATPVYKASYTGVLKAYLDLLPQKALVGKVILPVAIGGTIAHLLSIDYALKPVLSALGASHLLQGVYALDTQVKRDEQGGFELDEELAERLNGAVGEFAQEVKWHEQKRAGSQH